MYLLWTVSANNHVYGCTELKLTWSFQNFRYANKCVRSRLLQAPAWPARILLQRPAGAVNLLSMCGQGPAGRTKYACGHCRCHAGCLRTRLLTSWLSLMSSFDSTHIIAFVIIDILISFVDGWQHGRFHKNGQKGPLPFAELSRLPLLVKWVTSTMSGICTKRRIQGNTRNWTSMGYEVHRSSKVLLQLRYLEWSLIYSWHCMTC
jgi:hypothetical protein